MEFFETISPYVLFAVVAVALGVVGSHIVHISSRHITDDFFALVAVLILLVVFYRLGVAAIEQTGVTGFWYEWGRSIVFLMAVWSAYRCGLGRPSKKEGAFSVKGAEQGSS